MSESVEFELFRQHRDGQSKIAYNYMAVSGACIGFSLFQTKEAWLGWNHLPLGFAVALWASSFLCALIHMNMINRLVHADLLLVRLKKIQTPSASDTAEIKKQESIIARLRKWSMFNGRFQFRFFVLGALFYLGWHVLEMYLRASNPLLEH
jgi:hypothetical protein